MNSLLVSLFLKVFLFIFSGFVIGKSSGVKPDKIIRGFVAVIIYVMVPLFLILSIWNNRSPLELYLKISVLAVFVVVIMMGIAYLWSKMAKIRFRRYFLPVVFMNSAFLAIPVNNLLWGSEGVVYAVVYSSIISILHFTIGIWFVSKGENIREAAKLPFLYAVIAGFVLKYLDVPMPYIVETSTKYVSIVTIYSMLLMIGYKISKIKLGVVKLSIAGVFLRIAGGFIISMIITDILGLSGIIRGVCVISSIMPSAINNYVLSEYFDADSGYTATSISIGTAVTIFTVPIVVYYFL